MLEYFIDLDKSVFLYLNGLSSDWADVFMWWFSQSVTWIPVAVILALVIAKAKGRESVGIFLAIALMILISDQVSSGIIKNSVQRLRPTHDPSLQGLVYTVNGYIGGLYGFVSSHAANSICIAVFVSLLFKNRNISAIILSWALIDCYSRIYLGVHYPGDILGGLLVGTSAAFLAYFLLMKIRPQCFNGSFSKSQVAVVNISMLLSISILAVISFFM